VPATPVPGFLKYRVLNSNTGAVVIPDLPHPRQSTWTVRALQQGLPGSSTIGDFTIPLYAPGTDEFKKARKWYDLLAPGQKVEGYLGDAIAGFPRFSGVITKLRRPMSAAWEISGADTLWWLQQSQLFDGEVCGPGTSAGLVAGFMASREVVWDGSYPQNHGGFSQTNADGQLGLPALYSTSASTVVAYTNESWNAINEYCWPTLPTIDYASQLTIFGTLIGGTSVTLTATAEVLWLTDTTWANGYMARVLMGQTGAGTGLYNIDVEIWYASGGVPTRQAFVQKVFQNVGPTFPYQLTVTLYNLNATGHHWHLFLNGKDTGLDYAVLDAGQPFASGRIGIRAQTDGTGGGSYFNKLRFESRTGQAGVGTTSGTWGTDRFKAGSVTVGSATVEQMTAQGQTHLDMLLLASSLDGYQWRKTPVAGYKSDQLDYGPSVGSDLSASVIFAEGVNIEAEGTEVAPVADLFATSSRVNAIPGTTSGGSMTWPVAANGENVGGNPSNGGDIVLMDTVSDLGTPGFALLMGYAQVVAARKADPMQAMQVTVTRTPETADKWRELDFVTVHIPTLGVYYERAQVMGYTFAEGQATQTVYLNQFPDRALVKHLLQRLQRPIDYLSTTYVNR
jgi:hypothetical protein